MLQSAQPAVPSPRPGLLALAVVALATTLAACSDAGSGSGDVQYPTSGDPGVAEWQPVAADRVVEECGLDPELLAQADARIGLPWAVVR